MRRSTVKVIKVEMMNNVEEQEFSYERPAITNFKLGCLIIFTFGLIVAMFALT